MRARLIVIAAIAAGATTVPAAAHASTCAGADTPIEEAGATATALAIECLVNEERAEHGLAPLTAESRLRRAAQVHTDDMAARGYFSHSSPEGSRPEQRIAQQGYAASATAENIANGAATAADVVDMWMESDAGHRQIVLSRKHTEFGAGASAQRLYTLVLARPGAAGGGPVKVERVVVQGTRVTLKGRVPGAKAGRPVTVALRFDGRRATKKVKTGGGGAFKAVLKAGRGEGPLRFTITAPDGSRLHFTFGDEDTTI